MYQTAQKAFVPDQPARHARLFELVRQHQHVLAERNEKPRHEEDEQVIAPKFAQIFMRKAHISLREKRA